MSLFSRVHHHRSDIYGHFRFTNIDFYLWALISLSPPWIGHLWAFQIHHHGLCMHLLQLSHHHRFSSMSISVDSLQHIFIFGPLRLSPPQIFICGPLRVSSPQIDIYGHFNCIIIVGLHLWAFQFGVQSQLFDLASRAFFFSQFGVQSQFCQSEPQLLIFMITSITCFLLTVFTFHLTSLFVAYVLLTSL